MPILGHTGSMRVSKDAWNAATICGIFVFLIVFTASAPKLWPLISPLFEGETQVSQVCKPFEQGLGGMRVSRSRAELLAISKWSKYASKHGKLYGFWSNAQAKKMHCRKLSGSPVYNCAAKARPCKNVTAFDLNSLQNTNIK